MHMMLTWILLAVCAMAHAEPLALSTKCDDKLPCVEMDLNHGSAWKKSTQTAVSEPGSDGNSKFTLSVSGKLRNAAAKKHAVEFTAYTDGIECTDFGQGKVAVLGMSGANPVLLTNKGPLEVTDKTLKVGCAECVRFVDKKTKKSAPTLTRTSNMTATEIGSMSVDDTKRVFYRQGDKCVEVAKGTFKAAASESCIQGYAAKHPPVSVDTVSQDFPWLKRSNQETVHDLGGHLLVVKLSACT